MLEDYGNALSSTKNDSDFETQPYADTPLPYVEAPHVKMPSPSTATPSTPSDQPPASPTEENQLAAAYQLGNVLKCYKSEPTAFTTDDLPIAPATRRASGPNNS